MKSFGLRELIRNSKIIAVLFCAGLTNDISFSVQHECEKDVSVKIKTEISIPMNWQDSERNIWRNFESLEVSYFTYWL